MYVLMRLFLVSMLLSCGRSGLLTYPRELADGGFVNDAGTPDAGPKSQCRLVIESSEIDFGTVMPASKTFLEIKLRNLGQGECIIKSSTFEDPTDARFGIVNDLFPVVIPPNSVSSRLFVSFSSGLGEPPIERTGTLALKTSDASQSVIRFSLRARLTFCKLEVAPASVAFGNVTLNTTANAAVALTNVGSQTCAVSQIRLSPQTDSRFSIPNSLSFVTVLPSQTVSLPLRFAATDSMPPHLRTGQLLLSSVDTSGTRNESHTIELSAFINTVCTAAGQFIYTVDTDGRFSRFDPRTLSYVDIAQLNCPTLATPFSMNVDQEGSAWIIFGDGNLFRVDTATGACRATSYVPNQNGFSTFGMGSVFNAQTGTDTLYVSEFKNLNSRLGSISFPGLTVSTIGPLAMNNTELAGTGDGQLWGFTPANPGMTPELARIDTATGVVVERHNMQAINSSGGWAIKFFAGAFYVFIGADVWKVERSSLNPAQSLPTSPPQKVLTSPGREIVGAGISTCAPVQQ
jgi:hypothetical protein